MKYAINILSFNRPHYLRQALLGLSSNNLKDCDVYLWQDGYKNPYSKRIYSEVAFNDCLNTFKDIMKTGTFIANEVNLGIGLMYRQMKEFTFKNYEVGIFIEDDLVIGPHYLDILKSINEQNLPKGVGSVTAYGPDRFVSNLEQYIKQDELEYGIPSWGYMVTKDQYNRRRKILEEEYFPLIEQIDYRDRDDNLICNKWLKPNNIKVNSTSQDTADTIAMLKVGDIKLSTCTRNATYMGAVGEHFSAEEYSAGYYNKDQIFNYNALPKFKIPDLKSIHSRIVELGYA